MFDISKYGWSDIVAIVANILSLIFPLLVFYKLNKKNFKSYSVLILFSLILTFLVYSFQDSFIFIILFHAFSIIAISLAFGEKLRKIMIIYLAILLSFIIIEGALLLAEFIALEMDYVQMAHNPLIVSAHAIFVGISTFLVFKKFKINKLIEKHKESLQRVIVILLNIPFLIIVFKFLLRNDILAPEFWIFLIMFFLLMFIVINFTAIKIFSDEISEKKIIKEYEEYVKSMIPFIEGLKAEQHDFNNHLHVVQSLAIQKSKKSKRELINYIKKIDYDSGKYSLSEVMSNKILAAIVTVKKMTAEQKEIEFTIDLETDILPCKNYEQTKLISNLLDNAIESAEKCKEEKKVIIKSYIDDDKIIYLVSNTVADINEIKLDKMFVSKITSKKENKEHGYGLMEVKRIVEKYKGSIAIDIHENIISIEIAFETMQE